MVCSNYLFTILVTFAVALITYNIITFANSRLQLDLPDDINIPVDLSRGKLTSSKRLFHTAVTASDSVYNTWQTRIMYYWFKKFKNEAGSEMGGFTRILHSGKPDQYMDEIPTLVVQPLSPEMDLGYIVLNRPWAFVQWLHQANIKEDYILMCEPDHIIVKPIPNLATDELASAFPIFYIKPKKYEFILRKYYPEKKDPSLTLTQLGTPL